MVFPWLMVNKLINDINQSQYASGSSIRGLDHPPVTCPTAPGALGPEPGNHGGSGAGGRAAWCLRLGRFRNKMWKRLDLTIQNSDMMEIYWLRCSMF